jgi:hypothetical protein
MPIFRYNCLQTAGHSRGDLCQYSGTTAYRQLDTAEVAYANIQVQLLTDSWTQQRWLTPIFRYNCLQTAGHSRGGLRQYSGTAAYRQLDTAEVAYANIQVQLLTDSWTQQR